MNDERGPDRGVPTAGDELSDLHPSTTAGKPPLSGKRILVTRAGDQAGELSRLLAEAGADPIELPTIALEPPESWDPVDAAITELEQYDWLVFTSANGVRTFFERLRFRGRDSGVLKGTEVAAIGPATADALVREGILPDFVPAEFVAEAIVAGLVQRGVTGKRVLTARATEAREVLVDSLRDTGALVSEVHVYRTVVPESSRSRLHEALGGRIDAVTFASSSSVRNLVALLGDDAESRLSTCVVACIGPITAKTARDVGLRVDVVASEYTIPGLARALEAHFRRIQVDKE